MADATTRLDAPKKVDNLPAGKPLFKLTIEIPEGTSVDQFLSELSKHSNELVKGLHKGLSEQLSHLDQHGFSDTKKHLEDRRVLQCWYYGHGSCGQNCCLVCCNDGNGTYCWGEYCP